MNAWVYHTAGRQAEAAALIAKLRASGEFGTVIPANSRYYQGEVHKGCIVYHDGSRRDIVWAHEREGVELRQFAGQEMQAEVKPKPLGNGGPSETKPPEKGDAVIQAGTWFTAYRDGVKVGASKRTEDEAWELLGGRPK